MTSAAGDIDEHGGDKLKRLRARDEAATAVVRAWHTLDQNHLAALVRNHHPRLAEELDALARAHEDDGTDR